MQLSMHDVRIPDEYSIMNSENINSNIRRSNPFRSKDRVAFPPFDEALALPNKQLNQVTANASASGSPGWMDLTIGMQALIHPDSFTEDQVSIYSEDSHTPRPLVDLSSPDRSNDSCHNTDIYEQNILEENDLRPEIVPERSLISRGGRKIQQADDGSLDISSDSINEPPCMADVFAAFGARKNIRSTGAEFSTQVTPRV